LKTPPEENVYRTYGSHLGALGFEQLAKDFYNDVMSGDIPLDKVGKTTVENYVRNTAKLRIAEEKAAKDAAKAYKRNAENTLRQRAQDVIPNDKTFGNAGVIELTKDTPEYEIIRTMSEDTAVLDHCVGQGGSASRDDKNPWYGNGHRSYEPILDLVTGQPNPRATSDRTSYVRQVLGGDKIASVRDLSTGLPQATLHLEQSRIGANGQQKYNIGYASGHQNGDVDAKYAPAIRDYLNSIADQIDGAGHNLESHAGVYDMYDADFGSAMRRALNMGKQQFEKYDLQSLPRFVTLSDVRAAIKATDLTAASPAKSELVELNYAMEDAMQEHADLMRMARRRPLEDSDREYIAELESNINTLRQRINDIMQQATAPAPVADNAAAAAGALMAEPELFTNYGMQPFDFAGAVDRITDGIAVTVGGNIGGVISDRFNTIAHRVAEQTNPRLDPVGYAEALRRTNPALEHAAVVSAVNELADQVELQVNTPVANQPRPQAIAVQGDPMPNLDTSDLLAAYRDRLSPEQVNWLQDFAARFENEENPEAVGDLIDEYSRWRSMNRLAHVEGQRPDYMGMTFDAAQELTRQMGQEAGDEMRAAIRAITEGQGIDPANDTAQYIHQLRLAADDAARGTVEIAMSELADMIEGAYMRDWEPEEAAPPPAQLRAADIDNLRNERVSQIEDMLGDATADADDLRRLANAVGNQFDTDNHWMPLSETERRAYSQELRQRANYIEFNPRDFAQRIANEANMDIPELRDTIQALNDGNFDHEILLGLPVRERSRAEQATAVQLQNLLRDRGIPGYQAGGSVKKPEVKTPWLGSVSNYSDTVAYEMYPGQRGQDDQRDAARHMLAAGTLSRKYGAGPAEFLGKAHEYVTSPLQAVKTLFGGKMPADFDMDTHNNAVGAKLGQRAKTQAELEDLVQEEAERASRTQTPDKAFIRKANGGIVQQNPTTDQMRYALMMRRK
jgi:hypothetical protein